MKKILIAYDGGEPAQRALEQGAELAAGIRGRLGVISVTPWRGGRVPDRPVGRRRSPRQGPEVGLRLAEPAGLSADLRRPLATPADHRAVAEAGDFDTIIVGTRGLGPLGRFMQGSVSEHLATNAKATVVIAR